jgi:hypothetical protein
VALDVACLSGGECDQQLHLLPVAYSINEINRPLNFFVSSFLTNVLLHKDRRNSISLLGLCKPGAPGTVRCIPAGVEGGGRHRNNVWPGRQMV